MKLYKGKYPIPDSIKYVVEYVYDGNFYVYQLVRVSDDAVLCSFETLTLVYIECWKRGYDYEAVVLI